MDHDFQGKVCVVTGAGSGIGRALAVTLAKGGAALALSDINEAGLEETRRLIDAASNRIRIDILDVADAEAVQGYASAVRESLGAADALFNVAGISRMGTFAEMPMTSFEKVMAVNFWGVVRMAKAFLPQLVETKGRLVNISSLYGIIGVPGQTHYCASKFGVRGFSESLAAELKEDGVSVTSVHPGGVATNIARSAQVDNLPEGMTKEEINARFDKVAITSPEKAAQIILAGAVKRKRRVMVGPDAKVVSLIQRLFPESYAKLVALLGANRLSEGVKAS